LDYTELIKINSKEILKKLKRFGKKKKKKKKKKIKKKKKKKKKESFETILYDDNKFF